MFKKKLSIVVIGLFLVSGCSDEGDTPTDPGDNGNDPVVTITISNATAEEGDDLTFSVTLNTASTEDVSYSYATQNGTANATDYNSATGSNIITVGTTTSSITVMSVENQDFEQDENFTMRLSNASVEFLNNDSLAIGTITDDDSAPMGVSFASDVQPIISGRCAISGCHGSGASSGGFSFGSASYSNVRNASGAHGALITMGNAATSNLYLKTTTNVPFGSRMPLSGSFLSITQQEKIRDWINQGALDN